MNNERTSGAALEPLNAELRFEPANATVVQGAWLRRERIAIFLALCALGAIIILRFYEDSYDARALRISEQADEASRSTERLVVTMLDAETGQRGYLLTSLQSFLLPFQDAVQDLPSVLADFRSTVERLPIDRATAKTIERLSEEKMEEMKAAIMLKQTSDAAALDLVRGGKGDRLMQELRKAGSELVASYKVYAMAERAVAQRHARITLTVTAIGSTLAGAILLLAGRRLSYSFAAQQQLFTQMHERELQYQRLADRLQMVREEERAHLAREIHDVLGQSFTGIKLDLAAVTRRLESGDSQNAVQTLRQGAAAVDDSIRLLRKIATELRPPLLDHIGLAAAIEAHAKDFANRTGVAFELNLTKQTIALSPDERIALYRIFQESLTNVSRHAGATRLSVLLRFENSLVSLRVQDNGRGFDTRRSGTSLGLLGMQERARLIGAQFSMSSQSGEGTVVGVDLRLEPRG